MDGLNYVERLLPLLISLATAFGAWRKLRSTASVDYVAQLEARVEFLERELKRCEEARAVLLDQNLALTAKLLRERLKNDAPEGNKE